MKLRVLFVVVAALHLVPVWRVDHLPTVDGPSHVYNAVVLHELAAGTTEFTRVFRADLRPHPNWLGHAILFLLLYVATPVVAEKILFSLILVLFLAGAWMLAGVTDERNRVYAFLVMPLAFHLLQQMGFYNYALGAALVPFALVAAWNRKRGATAGLLVLLYFTHALPAAMAMLLVALLIVMRRTWRDAVVLAAPALLFGWFALQPKLPGGDWSWSGSFLLQPLLRVALLTSGTILGIAFGLLIVLTLVRGPGNRTFLLLTIMAVALYLFAPMGVQEGFVLKARLLLFPYLLILPWLTPRIPAAPLAIVLSLVAVVNVVFVRNQWKRNAEVIERSISVLDAAEPRKTIVPLLFDRTTPYSTLPLLSHAIAYAAAERRLVSYGNYEAGLGFFPVAFRAVARPPIVQLETAPADYDPEQYAADYVYVWRVPPDSPLTEKLLRRYEQVGKEGDATLYRRH